MVFKVLVIGHRRVGKTSIINQLSRMSVKVLTDSRHDRKQSGMKLTSNSLRFIEATLLDMPYMRRLTIGTADAFILTYAADDIESMDYINVLMENIKEIKGKDVPLIVVSNKNDIDISGQKRFEAGCILTTDSKYEHVEISARTGSNLKDIFSFLPKCNAYNNEFPENKSSDVNKDRTLKKKLGTFFRRIFGTH